jgi:hypothetical protein
MQLSDFRIGSTFWFGNYQCTDLGTRVVVGIRINHLRVADHQEGVTLPQAKAGRLGPPYAADEEVFDEEAQAACAIDKDIEGIAPDLGITP